MHAIFYSLATTAHRIIIWPPSAHRTMNVLHLWDLHHMKRAWVRAPTASKTHGPQLIRGRSGCHVRQLQPPTCYATSVISTCMPTTTKAPISFLV